MLNRKLEVLAALITFSSLAFADAYESPAEVLMPVGFESAESESAGDVMSCTEARATTWFERELARTDGGPAPDVEYTPCKPEYLAQSTADAD